MKKQEICKLCDKKDFLSKSHIYPDFLFKEMKDNKSGKIISFSKNFPFKCKEIVSPYERLLCAKCEEFLNTNYENIIKKFLFGDKAGKIVCKINKVKNGGFIELYGINSKTIKNFILSILWRCSVATRSPFDRIKLDLLNENKIKHIVINNSEISENEYPIHIYSVVKCDINNVTLKDIIVEPFFYNNRYWIIFSGLIFSIYIDNNIETCIRQDNTLLYLELNEDNPFIRSIFDLNKLS